jgi:hypothetical protein
VSQLQLAFLRFHNRVLADVKADLGPGYTRQELFAEAQRWCAGTTSGWSCTSSSPSPSARRWSTTCWPTAPALPLAQRPLHPGRVLGAAYRFGHSQVRPSYRANFAISADDPLQQFFALFLDPAVADPDDPADLRGGRRAARRFIDWQTFFDFGDGRVRPNKQIDTKLSSVLFRLLGQPEGEPTSLATRNLLRNLTMEVPSGQRVARAMQLPELAPADLQDLEPLHLERRTPLWFYVLREAEVTASPTCARTRTGRRPTGRAATSPWSTCCGRPGWWPPSPEGWSRVR